MLKKDEEEEQMQSKTTTINLTSREKHLLTWLKAQTSNSGDYFSFEKYQCAEAIFGSSDASSLNKISKNLKNLRKAGCVSKTRLMENKFWKFEKDYNNNVKFSSSFSPSWSEDSPEDEESSSFIIEDNSSEEEEEEEEHQNDCMLFQSKTTTFYSNLSSMMVCSMWNCKNHASGVVVPCGHAKWCFKCLQKLYKKCGYVCPICCDPKTTSILETKF